MDYTLIENLEEKIPEIPENSIISQTFLDNSQMKVILFGFSPGQELSEHTASMPAILHFIKGKAAITLGDVKSDAQTNSWIYMPPNLPHSIVAETELIMLLLLLKNP